MPIIGPVPVNWAQVKTPNKYGEYSVTLLVDDKTADSFSSRGFRIRDNDGQKELIIKRKGARKDGTPNQTPKLLDANKEPLDVAVGNGSKVNVQYREWETSNNYGDFKGLDLQAVQVVDLVEYTGSDGSELQPIDYDLEF